MTNFTINSTVETTNNKTTRKGQVHRLWTKVVHDFVAEYRDKHLDYMSEQVVEDFLKFMLDLDSRVKSEGKDNSFRLMVGKYKNKTEDEFKNQLLRQVEAFKLSRNGAEINIDIDKLIADL